VVAVLLLISSSCATPLKDVITDYDKAKVCCSSLVQLPYEVTQLGQQLSFKIDNVSPAYDFPEGKSFFKAYTLPIVDSDYIIALYSYLNGVLSWSENDSHIFYPVLMFLDKDHKVLLKLSSNLMRYEPPSWEEPSRLEGKLIVPASVGARYLVIYTTKQLLEQRTTFSYPASTSVFMSGNIAVPVRESASSRRYPHSPIGNLKISIGVRVSPIR
jgi:maltose operon protein